MCISNVYFLFYFIYVLIIITWEAVTDLHKHCEEDDGDDGGEEHVSLGEMISVQQVDQREGDRSSQSAVSDDKLVLRGELDDTELVDHEGQADNTFG